MNNTHNIDAMYRGIKSSVEQNRIARVEIHGDVNTACAIGRLFDESCDGDVVHVQDNLVDAWGTDDEGREWHLQIIARDQEA